MNKRDMMRSLIVETKDEPYKLDLLSEADFDACLPEHVRLAMKAYDDGYDSGINWRDAWETHGKPGGPWVYTDKACGHCRSGAGCDRQVSPRFTCAQSLEHMRQSVEQNKLWRQGWEDGHARKPAKKFNDLARELVEDNDAMLSR